MEAPKSCALKWKLLNVLDLRRLQRTLLSVLVLAICLAPDLLALVQGTLLSAMCFAINLLALILSLLAIFTSLVFCPTFLGTGASCTVRECTPEW